MRLTMPQIIMISAGAETNRLRLDRRVQRNQDEGKPTVEEAIAAAPLWKGKRIDQLTSEEYLAYHNET